MVIEKKYQSERLTFELFRPELINDEYLSWFKNKERTKFIYTKGNLTKEDALKYVKSNLEDEESILIHVSLKFNNQIIGTIRISNIKSKTNFLILSLFIGKIVYSGNGYGREFLKIGKAICRDIKSEAPIRASIDLRNTSSIITFLKSGFKIKSISKDIDKNGNNSRQLNLEFLHEKN